jgi:hypothetical protein
LTARNPSRRIQYTLEPAAHQRFTPQRVPFIPRDQRLIECEEQQTKCARGNGEPHARVKPSSWLSVGQAEVQSCG